MDVWNKGVTNEYKKFLKKTLHSPLANSLFTIFERIESQEKNLLRILTYHRVPDTRPFAQHIEHITDRHHVISVEELLTALDGESVLPPRSLLITFDDAYRDVAVNAWPVLKAKGISALIFVATHYPDHPDSLFWWDNLHRAIMDSKQTFIETPLGQLSIQDYRSRKRRWKQLRTYIKKQPHDETLAFIDELVDNLDVPSTKNEVLSWDELVTLANSGLAIGAHSHTHPLLNRVSSETARLEILQSLQNIEDKIGPGPRLFAYPGGNYDSRIRNQLQAAGVHAAFTTFPGTNNFDTFHNVTGNTYKGRGL